MSSLSKSEILEAFNDLKKSELDKIYKFSNVVKMLYPDENLLLNANYSDMLTEANRLSAIHLPEWTDDLDFGTFIKELICYFSEKDFQYINNYSREAHFSTSTIYSNAYVKSIAFGYTPNRYKGATATFQVTFPGLLSLSIDNPIKTYSPGELSIEQQNGSLKMVNRDSFTIADSYNPTNLNVVMVEGSYELRSFTFNGAYIYLDSFKIDLDSIVVSVDADEFTRVELFGNSSSTAKHFIALPEEDGRAIIYFGDGEYGSKPDVGASVSVSYRLCDGVDGNTTLLDTDDVSPLVFNISASRNDRLADSAVPVDTETLGGTDSDSLNAIKNSAPLLSAYRGTILNPDGCRAYLLSLPYVAKAMAVFQNNVLFFAFIRVDGVEPTQQELNALSIDIQKETSFGISVVGQTNDYKALDPIEVDIKINFGYSIPDKKVEAEELILDYFSPLVGGAYGKDFDRNSLYLHIFNNINGIIDLNIYYKGTTNLYSSKVTIPNNSIIGPLTISGASPSLVVNVSYL